MGSARARVLLAVAAVAGALVLAAAAPSHGATPSSADPSSGWRPLSNPPPFNPGVAFLLTDGRVLVQDEDANGNWWLLRPDAQGSYADGTWSPAASLFSGYAPLDAADAVLPDGRLILEGGEYNQGISGQAETTMGAIYDPVANTWKAVAPPAGEDSIGDAPSVVLTDGSFMLGPIGDATEQILDASNLTWTPTGAGKTDYNSEEGFTLLPDGDVLTVDTGPASCQTGHSEVYNPVSGAWTSAGSTPSTLILCTGNTTMPGYAGEVGPQLLMYDGKVFVEGAASASALYDTVTGTWSAGPTLPTIGGKAYVADDAPSAILPDGNVLFSLSPRTNPPTHFFLFDGTSITQVADDADAPNEAAYYGDMLMLPTGQVLFSSGRGASSMELYSDGGAPSPAWAPQVASVPSSLAAGKTYFLSGTQLNGLSDGAAFGDDYQTATDYPLVQITDNATGTVTYARTSGMTNRSIAPGASSCTNFALPAGIPLGAGELRVIANGIASAPVAVTVGATGDSPARCAPPSLRTLRVFRTGNGSGTVTSSPAGIACGSTCLYSFAPGTSVTLTANGGAKSSFKGWSGACSGTGTCTVTMTANRAVVADFEQQPVQEKCRVPKLKGKKLAAAERILVLANCRVGKVKKVFSATVKRGRVLSQRPRPGTTISVKSPVRLTVSKGKRKHR